MENKNRLWKVTGSKFGVMYEVKVRADKHIDAVGKASKSPHMLCVKSCVLIDE